MPDRQQNNEDKEVKKLDSNRQECDRSAMVVCEGHEHGGKSETQYQCEDIECLERVQKKTPSDAIHRNHLERKSLG